MKSEDNYYDHYKDSWSLQQTYLSERNKLTVTLLVLLVLVTVFMYEPAMMVEKLNTYLDSRVKGLAFGMKYLNTGLTFLLLWVVTRYYQTVMKIDRLYDYLNECETKLCKSDGVYKVNREGAYYRKTKTWMAWFLNICYGAGLPVVIIIIAIKKICKESSWATDFKVYDIIGLSFIIFFSLLYMSKVWLHEEYFDKKRYPGMKRCERWRSYFFGESRSVLEWLSNLCQGGHDSSIRDIEAVNGREPA